MGASSSTGEVNEAEEMYQELQESFEGLKSLFKNQTLIDKLKELDLTKSRSQTKKITDDFLEEINPKIKRLMETIKKLPVDYDQKKAILKRVSSAKMDRIDKSLKLHKQLKGAIDDLLQKIDDNNTTRAKAEETLKCIQKLKDKAAQFKNSLNSI